MKIEKQVEKLRAYYRKYGDLPTYDEMTEIFGYRSKSAAHYSVNKMIKTGFLTRKNGKLVPGKNFTGLPYLNEKNAFERMSLNKYLIDKPNSTILISVSDSGMVNAGIYNKDIVIVEKASRASVGQTVVVNVDGKFMVKKLSKKGNCYVLESANPDYPDLPLNQNTQSSLIGIVKGVVRKY